MNKDFVTVSVHMVTYNHELFISEAIEGILKQQTNFKFELIIGEDKSTDDTLKICLAYQKKYPEIIKIIERPRNIGSMANFLDLFKYCKGEYIAICEGDDYWTDPYKLQKQFDILENNRGLSICCHNVTIDNLIFGNKQEFDKPLLQDLTIKDLCKRNFISTPSTFFKNKNLDVFCQWAKKCCIGDYPLFLYLSQFGDIYYIDEVMAVYRVHDKGVWNGSSYANSLLKFTKTIEIIIENIPQIKDDIIDLQIDKYKEILSLSPDLLNDIPSGFKELFNKNENLKAELNEISRKYALIKNSKMVRLIEWLKKFLVR